jgi:hypothetical protein
MSTKWYWLNSDWIELPAPDAKEIEEEYLLEINGTLKGQRVYHCFGNGWSTCINFTKMRTYCSSAKCILQHEKRGLPDDHLTFQLKRVQG